MQPYSSSTLVSRGEPSTRGEAAAQPVNRPAAELWPSAEGSGPHWLPIPALVADSPAMRRVLDSVIRVAGTESTVLLEGETGTGKDVLARAIHGLGPRAAQPYVVVDCGGTPASLLESLWFGHEAGSFTGAFERRTGSFEQAAGGTLFLDEIGELPLELQPKLLRVLESRSLRRLGGSELIDCNLRVIAATHRDLRAMVAAGRFRADLYFRLAVMRIVVPPLRDRPQDVSPLVHAFLAERAVGPEQVRALIDPEFLAALERASWPGNIRELRNHLERCLALGQVLWPEGQCAPAEPQLQPYEEARREAMSHFDRRYLEALLVRCDGNVTAAARASGLSRTYLHRLLRRCGLRGE